MILPPFVLMCVIIRLLDMFVNRFFKIYCGLVKKITYSSQYFSEKSDAKNFQESNICQKFRLIKWCVWWQNKA